MRKIKKISKDDALMHITRTQTAVVVPVLLAFYFLKESAFISNSLIISILCLFIGVLASWIVIKTTSHKYLSLKIGKFFYFVEFDAGDAVLQPVSKKLALQCWVMLEQTFVVV